MRGTGKSRCGGRHGSGAKSRRSRCEHLSPLPLDVCHVCGHRVCGLMSAWEARRRLRAQGLYQRLLTRHPLPGTLCPARTESPDSQFGIPHIVSAGGHSEPRETSGTTLKIQKSFAPSTVVVRACQTFHVCGKTIHFRIKDS